MANTRQYPDPLLVPGMGAFTLDLFEVGDDVVVTYHSQDQLSIPGRGKAALIVWPPSLELMEAPKMTAEIQRVWGTIINDLSESLRKATPLVEEAISSFCEAGPDYAPPAAHELLEAMRLAAIYIHTDGSSRGRLEGGGDHKIMFSDERDIIGGHDLFIILDSDFQPVFAYFDG